MTPESHAKANETRLELILQISELFKKNSDLTAQLAARDAAITQNQAQLEAYRRALGVIATEPPSFIRFSPSKYAFATLKKWAGGEDESGI